jgi:lysyl-tRNA synthetase, class II
MPLEDLRKNRFEKLAHMKERNINPYPIQSNRTHLCQEIIDNFTTIEKEEQIVTITGRVKAIRSHGGSIFLDIEDKSAKLQLFLKKDLVGEKQFNDFKDLIDVGDFIQAQGEVFKTKVGEVTLKTSQWQILSKSLNPLPDNWYGLKDKETRYRKRYLDLIFNPELKNRLRLRSVLIKRLRNILDKEGFLEVETPILQNQAGGALAKPFKTHLNALGIDLYLRIAPEIYLKKLIIGGFEKVYELGKSFRNEGIDYSHNPEFTTLEFYWAYSDHEKLMTFTEEIFCNILDIFPQNSLVKKLQQAFSKSLPRLKYGDVLKDKANLDMDSVNVEKLKKILKKEGIKNPAGDKWSLVDEVLKKVCLPKFDYPFFLINHPLVLSPLAKKNIDKPSTVARFQLIIEGLEIINAYAELNNPRTQKERFEMQKERVRTGEEETHPYDKDFVAALEYGMPPTAGWGLGIDRLVALLTGVNNLKEVILFPFMKPKN